MRFIDAGIVVNDSEVWQARLGFESVGAEVLSEKLRDSIGFEWDSKETNASDNTARLILAGNLALVGSLNSFGSIHPNADELRDSAKRTVDSAIEAIGMAETKQQI